MLSKKTLSGEFVERFNEAIVAVGDSGEQELIWRRYTSVR